MVADPLTAVCPAAGDLLGAHQTARLRRYGPIIVDEVGYLPFEQDAANLFFRASHRLRNRGIDTAPSIRTQDTAD